MLEQHQTEKFSNEVAASRWAQWMQRRHGQVRTSEEHRPDGSVEITIYYSSEEQ